MNSTYLQDIFTKHIDKRSIKTIVECGSRDCLDAIELGEYYNPDVIYSFECNPESIEVCKENAKNIENIKIIPKAVCEKSEILVFFATDMEKSLDKNIGASSLLIHNDNKISYFQKEIAVEGTRLDLFMEENNINKIDLLCMDLQGAEHLAIEGLGKRIKDVRYIITEVQYQCYYKGSKLVNRIMRTLHAKGFKMVACDSLEGYINHSGFGNMMFKNLRNG